MFKKIKLVVLAIVCFSINVNADTGGFYVGGGTAYLVENTDIDTLEIDNKTGFEGKLGYKFNDIFSVELVGNMTPGIECTVKTTPAFKFKADLKTYLLQAKLSAFKFKKASPYIVCGFGIMDVEVEGIRNGILLRGNQENMCFKSGIGVDYFIKKNIALYVEGSYVFGVDELEDIRYFSNSAGISYYF